MMRVDSALDSSFKEQAEIPENACRDLTAVVLVGGLGTRLRPAVADVPKPMAPVAGRPFLEILLAQFREAGCRDVVLCVGYKGEVIQEHFGNGEAFGLKIQYSIERELLGTGGALKLAAPLIRSERFWVANGDSYCAVDFPAMCQHHLQRRAQATLAAVALEDTARYGRLELSPAGAVLSFMEKNGEPIPGHINGGVYLLEKSLLERIPQDTVCSLERDIFPTFTGNGLEAWPAESTFIDIGLPEDWHRAAAVLPRSPFAS